MGSTVSTPSCSLSDAATALALAILGTGIQLNSASFTGNCESAGTISSSGLDYITRDPGIPNGAYFSTGSVAGNNVFQSGNYNGETASTYSGVLSTSFSTTPNATSICSTGSGSFYDGTSLRMDVTLAAGYSGYAGAYIYGTDETDRTSESPQHDNAMISIDGVVLNNPDAVTLSTENSGQASYPEYWHFDATSDLLDFSYSSCASDNIIEVTICDTGDSFYDSAVVLSISAVSGVCMSSSTSTTTTTTISSTTTSTTTSTTSDTTTTSDMSTTASSAQSTPSTPDTSSTSSTSASSSTSLPTTTSGACMVCNNNACLQSALAPTNTAIASSFCSSYLATDQNANGLPSYLSACTDARGSANAAAVTSACSCLLAISTAPMATSMPTGVLTIFAD